MQSNKIALEVTSPSIRSSEEAIKNSVEKISAAVKKLGNIDYINIPEIIEENHEGKPYYRNIDPREFGRLLHEKTGKEIIVNKVVAHLPSKEFETWLTESISKFNLTNFVFVGVGSDHKKYPGIFVTDANKATAKVAQLTNKNLHTGNITIPSRNNEVQKIIEKTASGCNFFTTQILYESSGIKKLLHDYDKECKNKSTKPATIFLSFAPAASKQDIEFFKWLGVEFTLEIENRLLQAGDEEIGHVSVKIIREIYSEIIEYREKNNIHVPISLNIEAIFLQNLELAAELIKSLKQK